MKRMVLRLFKQAQTKFFCGTTIAMDSEGAVTAVAAYVDPRPLERAAPEL